MKQIHYLLISLYISSCNLPNDSHDGVIKNSSACLCEKEEIHRQFILKNYDQTILQFSKFEECYIDKKAYLNKLGMLYIKNNQPNLAKIPFNKALTLYNTDQELSLNEKTLLSIEIYLAMKDQRKVNELLSQIDNSSLNRSQRKQVKLFNQYNNTSPEEFLNTETHLDFELFEY